MGHKERKHREGDRELCRRFPALQRFLQNRRGGGSRIVHPRSSVNVLTTPEDNVLPARNRGGFLMREILPKETIAELNDRFS